MADNKMKNENIFVPSDEQKRIIDAEISDRLVSAAAGSGKTTVLIHRIIELIIKGELSIDRLLVVTFTNDATSQLQNEIETALRERIKFERNAGNKKLAKELSNQLDLLPNAYIQTIDSFCSRVVKEKGYVIADQKESDLFDTGNVILEGSQLDIILKSAISKAIADEYLNAEPNDAFISLTKRFGDGRNDNSLAECVFQCYKKLRSLADYEKIIDEKLEERKRNDEEGVLKYFDDFIAIIKNLFSRITPDYIDQLENAYISSNLYFGSQSELKEKYNKYKNDNGLKSLSQARKDELLPGFISERFDIVRDIFEQINEAADLSDEDLFEAIRVENRLSQIKFTVNPKEEYQLINSLSHEFCAAILFLCKVNGEKSFSGLAGNGGSYVIPEEYAQIFKSSVDELLEYQKEGTAVCEVFVNLLKRTDDLYAEIKTNLHGMDFPDQEYAAYEILNNSDAANFYKNKFTEIYVDEYQDNTSLQDNIIKSFANNNVFRVGDVKQSIYGFRAADPKNFQDLYTEYNGTSNLSILKENYRSTGEILDFVNFIFEQEMTDSETTIKYDENQRLNVPQNADLVKTGDVPDIVIVDKAFTAEVDENDTGDGDSKESVSAEYDSSLSKNNLALAHGVALKVAEYLANPGTQYSDIRILTKKTGQAAAISKYLNSYGYPSTCVDKTQIFADNDINGILSMLIILGNEYRSEYLYSVLLSGYSFSNFTLEDISVISAFILDYNEKLIHSELIIKLRVFASKSEDSELKQRVQAFLDCIDNIRLSISNSDIDDIVERIYRETGIRATLKSRGEKGTKLLLLKNWLSSNYKRYGSDFSGIADSIEDMKIKIEADAGFEIKSSDENTIQAMTVHRSKGLGFKYTIFALDDSKGAEDKMSGIYFDKENGFILQNYDYKTLKVSDSIESVLMKKDFSKMSKNAESMRLLYVALTRPKNKLTIVTSLDEDKDGNPGGMLKEAVESAFKTCGNTFDKKHWIEGSGEMGYQLFSALAKSSEAGRTLREAVLMEEPDEQFLIPFNGFTCEVVTLADSVKKNPKAESSDAREDSAGVGIVSNAKYRYEDLITVPYKVAVTGIAHTSKNAKHLAFNVKSLDEYTAKTDGKINASTKGTIAHLMFRYMDMDSLRENPDCGEDLVRELISSGVFVRYSESDVLDVYREFADGILAFANHPIGMEMSEADLDLRTDYEKPIVFSVPLGSMEDSVLVQGVIDALFEDEDGSTVIIDYKTDNLGKLDPDKYADEVQSRHGFQINCYAKALEKNGVTIRAKYAYLVRYGIFVEIK